MEEINRNFTLVKNIYEDENFSFSDAGAINVQGTTSLNEIIKILEKEFPNKIKTTINENGVKLVDLS